MGTSASKGVHALKVGRSVEVDGVRLKVKRMIGEGGFARVYLVSESGRLLVLKRMVVLSYNDELLAMARRELHIMRSMPASRFVVRHIASGSKTTPDGYEVFDLLMELCEGGSATDVLRQAFADGRRPLPESRVVRIVHGVCMALAHLHSQQPPIAHRDLKAENVLFKDGDVKLCDFGSAATEAGVYSSPSDIARLEAVIDNTTTMHFRAPELCDLHATPRRRIDHAVDVWALGCLMYKLAFFVTPFEDSAGGAQRMGILSGRFRFPSDSTFSSEFHNLIRVCLEVDPSKRPSVFDVMAIATSTIPTWPNEPVPSPPPAAEPEASDPTDDAFQAAPPSPVGAFDAASGASPSADGFSWFGAGAGPSDAADTADGTGFSAGELSALGISFHGDGDGDADADADSNTMNGGAAPTAAPSAAAARPPPALPGMRRSGSYRDDASAGSPAPPVRRVASEPTAGAGAARPFEAQASPLGRAELEPGHDSAGDKVLRYGASIVESVQTRMMQLLGKDLDKHRWVIKATSRAAGPPKLKYIRLLVVDAWEQRGGGALLLHLHKRPVRTEPAVAVKALVALVKLWHQGPAAAIAQSIDARAPLLLAGMVDGWRTRPATATPPVGCAFGMPRFIVSFATVLQEKLAILQRQSFLTGQYLLVPDMSPAPTSILSAVEGMLVLLHSVGKLEAIAFSTVDAALHASRRHRAADGSAPAGNDSGAASGQAPGAARRQGKPEPVLVSGKGREEAAIVAGALPSLVVEAWGLYRGAFQLLQAVRRANDSSVTDATATFCDQLDAHLPVLRDFFKRVRAAVASHSIHPSLDMLTSLPALPEESPFSSATAAAVMAQSSHHEYVGVAAEEDRPAPYGDADEDGDGGRAAHSDSDGPGGGGGGGGGTGSGYRDSDDGHHRGIGAHNGSGYTDADADADDDNDDGFVSDDSWAPSLPARQAVEAAITALGGDGDGMDTKAGVQRVMSTPANMTCCECGDRKPKWASINLGVVFCLRCSGLHRHLGTHISQVRSCTLDDWKPKWVSRVLRVGNARAAKFWEAKLPTGERPGKDSSMATVLAFLKNKYEYRRWCAGGPSPDERLDGAVRRRRRHRRTTRPAHAAAVSARGTATASDVDAFNPFPDDEPEASLTRLQHMGDHDDDDDDDDDDDEGEEEDPFGFGGSPGEPSPWMSSPAAGADPFDPFAVSTAPPASAAASAAAPAPASSASSAVAPPLHPSPVQSRRSTAVHNPEDGEDPSHVAADPFDPFAVPSPAAPAPGHASVPGHVSSGGGSALAAAVVRRSPVLVGRSAADGGHRSGNGSHASSHGSSSLAMFHTTQPYPLHSGASMGSFGAPHGAFRSNTGIAPRSGGASRFVAAASGGGAPAAGAGGGGSGGADGDDSDSVPDLLTLGTPVPSFGSYIPADATASQLSAVGRGKLLAGVGDNGKGVLKLPDEPVKSRGDASMWTAGVEIRWGEIMLGPRIGAGGFAEVFRGMYRGRPVAVKKLLNKPGAAGDKALDDFKAEVAMMTRLRHPNIVLFIGVVVSPLCLVTEFCERGNLFDLLHNRRVPLSWPMRLRMALDAAKGMSFLHSSDPVIIHRDLKSLNLLVDEHWRVKVSDFGLSRFKAVTPSGLMTAQCGTFHWMAPEVIAGHRYTEKADVYSFAINLFELLTRAVPFKGMQPVQVGMAVLTRGLRPRLPPDTPRAYARLMEACWSAEPAARPSFPEIIDALQAIIDSTV